MINFANKTDLVIALNMAADMSGVNNKVTTPDAIARHLGDLSRLAILKGKFFVHAIGGTGSANVRLKAGGTVLATVGYAGATTTDKAAAEIIDLTGVAGNTDLTVEVECLATGDPLTVQAWVEVEHPVIISA